MNRTRIDWCDYTWNPVVGCTRGCSYCYARRFARRLKCPKCREFIPHLHPERLGEPTKVRKPSLIFCGSMGDLFDPHIRNGERTKVLQGMGAARQHLFILLTKRASTMSNWVGDMPPNVLHGVSIIDEYDCEDIALAAAQVVSFEPILGPAPNLIGCLTGVKWLIIGAETGPGAKSVDAEAVRMAVQAARSAGVPLWVKDNVVKQLPEFAGMQERPEIWKRFSTDRPAAAGLDYTDSTDVKHRPKG